MPKHQIHFAAISKITLEHEEGAKRSQLKHNDIRLEVSGNLDRSAYFDGKGLPSKEALKPISNAFLLGLISNIRMGAEKGWWKEHEHMEWVISELQRAYVAQARPGNGTMEY